MSRVTKKLLERRLLKAQKRIIELTAALAAVTRAVEFLKSGIQKSGRTDFWEVRERYLKRERRIFAKRHDGVSRRRRRKLST